MHFFSSNLSHHSTLEKTFLELSVCPFAAALGEVGDRNKFIAKIFYLEKSNHVMYLLQFPPIFHHLTLLSASYISS
jgi:hypothetical protein